MEKLIYIRFNHNTIKHIGALGITRDFEPSGIETLPK